MKHGLQRFEERVAAVGLPSRWVCAALVFVFLAFGTMIGRATRPQAAASDQRPLLELSSPSSPSGSSKPPAIAESTSTPEGEEEAEPAGESEAEGASESSGKSKASGGKGARQSGEGSKQGAGSRSSKASAKLPAIKHVFLIVLDDAAYAEVFGPESRSHYLASTLEGRGELLERFYAVSHQQLPNGIALISGEGPTEATAQDCPRYAEIAPAGSAADGQVTGEGCVYPSSVQTLASQMSEKHLAWRAYVQGIGNGGGSEASSACYHPQLGAEDLTSPFGLPGATAPAAGIVSATFRDPFVYFRSVTGSSDCGKDVVGIQHLRHDLASLSDTPSFSYIVPNLCEDGSTKPCAPGKPAGMAAADGFLSKVVPEVLASKAYKQNGLLVITVDEAPTTGEYADSSSCCGQPSFPNIHASASKGGSGGGEVGALLLSPFLKGGKISQETYNDFSLLRTIEDVFGVSHLGYAGASGVSSLSPSLFKK